MINGQLITSYSPKWTTHNKLPPLNGQLITRLPLLFTTLNYI